MLAIPAVLVDPAFIDQIHADKTAEFALSEEIPEPATNGYVLFKDVYDEKHTALARYLGHDRWQRIRPNKQLEINSYSPRDSHQAALMDCLVDPDILINVCIGSAGTGKTTLALASAAADYMNHGRKIILSKPTAMVGEGRAFGPVPGTIEEKYDPYLGSYKIVLNKVLKDKTYVDRMIAKGDIEFQPVELSRGCSFDGATFILDEAQNLTWHELNTIISRMGENTKMIVLGDLNQIDIPIGYQETGLYKLINAPAFTHAHIASAIELQNQYRSPITALIAEVNAWVNQH